MTTINIGGVPEHFNLPWYLTLKEGAYKKQGINLRWKDYYGGTGAMNQALRNNEIDLAVILTEGIIKDIIDGNPSKIIQTYVQSPLIWGIHTAYQSNFKKIQELKSKKAAISRYGSGSHLMAYINAKNNDWDLETDLKFEVVKNLDGAVEALTNRTADYFMWEKFTTKPLVDSKKFNHIANCPTPWPCFVIAATDKVLNEHEDLIRTILGIINTTTSEFKYIPNIDVTISNRYNQKLEDVNEWLNLTEWSQSLISKPIINTIQDNLLNINIIDKKVNYKELVYKI